MPKTAMPLLLVAGGAALVMAAGKKKKLKKPSEEPDRKYIEVIVPTEYGEGTAEKLILDEECNAIAEKIDFHKHNTYITSRYHQLLKEGVLTTPEEISLQLLREQSTHCNWDADRSQWTDLMRALYDQLFTAVKVYHQVAAQG